MSESACGGASTGSVATDKGFLQRCPECGKEDLKTPAGIANHCSAVHDVDVFLRKELNNPDFLWQKLYVENLDQKELADMLEVSKGSVQNALNKYGLDESRSHPWLDYEDFLFVEYINRDKSTKEIAEMLGTTNATVCSRLEKHDIDKRVKCKHKMGLKFYEKDLRQMVEDGMRIKDIAEKIDTSTTTVMKYISKFDLYIGRRSGENHPQYNGGPVELECHVCGDKYKRKAHREDNSRFCSLECAGKWRSDAFSGEGHPNWQGGYDGYYGENWSQQRRKALRRDQYRCQRCHKSQAELGQEPDVHHLTRLQHFKDNFDAPEWWELGNDLENLITMCRTCHHKWEGIPLRIDNRQW